MTIHFLKRHILGCARAVLFGSVPVYTPVQWVSHILQFSFNFWLLVQLEIKVFNQMENVSWQTPYIVNPIDKGVWFVKQLIVKVRWESSTHWVLLFMKRQESELLSVWLFQRAKAICDLLYFLRGSIGSYWSLECLVCVCLSLCFSYCLLASRGIC